MFVPLLPLGVLAFLLCARSLCDKRLGPEFPGKLSLHGIAGEDLNVTSVPVGTDVRPFVAAPSVNNGLARAHNWTASMLGPQRMVSKRAPDPLPRRYGPLWSQGNNCVFCPEQELLEQDALTLFRQLNSKKMKTYMRGTPADLYNKCVFYTKAEDRNTALASPATDWACLHNKYTAWHLWPNKRMAQQNPNVRDFYGAYEPGNWLYKLVELKRTRPPRLKRPSYAVQYFQAMSQAMAESCSGEVVIFTERPENMRELYSTKQPGSKDCRNIWGDKERPALRSLKNRGVVTNLYVIDARGYFGPPSPTPTVYDYNIVADRITGVSNKVFVPGFGRLMPRELLSNDTARAEWEEVHRLEKRSCSRDSGVASELPGADYFAGWYDQYPG